MRNTTSHVRFPFPSYLAAALLMCILMLLCLPVPQAEADSPGQKAACPWRITALQLGKWGNGKQKAEVWPKGFFPIPVGVSERPDWYVNGVYVGKSQLIAGGGSSIRFLPNASSYLQDGAPNTIRVEFKKPPHQGTFSEITVVIKWSKVGPGRYRTFK